MPFSSGHILRTMIYLYICSLSYICRVYTKLSTGIPTQRMKYNIVIFSLFYAVPLLCSLAHCCAWIRLYPLMKYCNICYKVRYNAETSVTGHFLAEQLINLHVTDVKTSNNYNMIVWRTIKNTPFLQKKCLSIVGPGLLWVIWILI